MTTLRESLRGASAKSRQLAELDDELAKRITWLEDLLRQHISVRISTKFDEHSLAFGKANGQWCLLVAKRHGREVPLLSASREIRTRVFAENAVTQLIAQAVVQLDEQIATRDKALEAAQTLIAALEVRS